MAAYAALASLMNNIEQMMKHPHLSNSFDKIQMQSLLEKSGFLLDIIERSRYAAGSKKAEDFERQLTSAAHAAEDIIESEIVDQIHAAGTSGDEETSSSCLLDVQKEIKDVNKKVHESELSRIWFKDHVTASPFVDLQRIIEDMEALMGKANEVMKIEREEHEQPTHSTLPLMESTGEPATAMVGLDDELTHLLDELTSYQSNRHTISIVGMGGMGKTILARNIYANQLIIEHFDVRAWATVSQQYDAQEILSQLLSRLGKSSSGNMGELGEQLHKALIGRRYLVILDDIWSVEAWDKVRQYCPDDGRSSSRVVLTTRLSNVASACSSSCLTMSLLDEEKSWSLFCEKASFPHKDDPLELEDVGKEIVRSCKGLALSIVVIGGLLLKSPRTIEYWESVAGNLKSTHNSKEKQESLDVLSLSYSQLPPHLKHCFLYMGVFREDSEIRVSNIIRLWVAEGFIRPNGSRVSEEIAEGCLKDLIDRNLIFVSRRRRNGDIGSCGIHDLLRDLCVKVAEQQEFFYVRGHNEIRNTDRRVVDHGYGHGIHFGSRLARSIFAKDFCVRHVGCKLLRVFGYAKTDVGFRQDVLYENVNTRYVAYQEPYFGRETTWKLPSSVSLIWNLQTLMISQRFLLNVLVVAPSQFWKMRQFRHIKFPKIYLPPLPSEGEDVLENFQTLRTAVNLRTSEEVCDIIPNIKKLCLHYDRDLLGYDDSLIECLCNLDRLIKLESLKMQINLQAPDYELHKKLAFPSSLRKLSLSHCRLHWNDLSMIGSLPQLQVLYLKKRSVTEGKQWSPANGHFRRLKFLEIKKCELYSWDADSSHFPVLEKLVIVRLYGLEEIPLDIGDIPTLGLIRVEYCSESAAISAVRIKEYQQDLDNDALQVQIKISNSQQERFMKRVETEQLTLNNIQIGTH